MPNKILSKAIVNILVDLHSLAITTQVTKINDNTPIVYIIVVIFDLVFR